MRSDQMSYIEYNLNRYWLSYCPFSIPAQNLKFKAGGKQKLFREVQKGVVIRK